MEQPNLTFAKIPILDTGKFEQWKFRNQHYIQNKHYALWKVIEFGYSYQAPLEETSKGLTSESSAKKKGRIVAITTEDMKKRKNDVKARTTLLLALHDEHKLRFSKTSTEALLAWGIMEWYGWRLLLGASSLLSLVVLLFYTLLPKSPRFLYAKEKAEGKGTSEKGAQNEREVVTSEEDEIKDVTLHIDKTVAGEIQIDEAHHTEQDLKLSKGLST
nr:organic cation/carnitine transporter 7-like [Tanacetum cinerariifolium]